MIRTIKATQGQVWWVKEQNTLFKNTRPYLVISSEDYAMKYGLYELVLLSNSMDCSDDPACVQISTPNGKISNILCWKKVTVMADDLINYYCSVPKCVLADVFRAIDITRSAEVVPVNTISSISETNEQVSDEDEDEIIEIKYFDSSSKSSPSHSNNIGTPIASLIEKAMMSMESIDSATDKALKKPGEYESNEELFNDYKRLESALANRGKVSVEEVAISYGLTLQQMYYFKRRSEELLRNTHYANMI